MANPNLNNDKQNLSGVDREFENNIRPAHIHEFAGQPQLIENLQVFIKAAKIRGEALDHVLFHGPPGLGKTTLSRIVANELGVNIKETSTDYVLEVAAPGLERKDFNIEVKNDTLTISGEKEEEKEEKKKKNGYSRKEYSFNSFSRSFSLPENADESAIKAKYENGILRISIAKTKEPAAQSPTKIQVS